MNIGVKLALSCAILASATPVMAGSADPHTLVPRSADWMCAQNTSQYAQVLLTNEGLIDQTQVDNARTDIRLLLKHDFGGGRSEQVFHLVLHQDDGKSIAIIAESTTESDGECPGSGVKVFVVSRELGEWPSQDWVLPPAR